MADAPHAGVAELALLGLLADSPMHGYQLRKSLTATLGTIRAFSYGSLYPALRRLERAGHIAVQQPLADPDAMPLTPRRARVTYRITAAGKEYLAELLADAGPQSWTDDGFSMHLAFFARTAVDTRMRILQGRRRRLEERRDGLRAAVARAARRLDRYTLQLQQQAIDASDREVRWLTELIEQERLDAPDPDVTVTALLDDPITENVVTESAVNEKAVTVNVVTENAADPLSPPRISVTDHPSGPRKDHP